MKAVAVVMCLSIECVKSKVVNEEEARTATTNDCHGSSDLGSGLRLSHMQRLPPSVQCSLGEFLFAILFSPESGSRTASQLGTHTATPATPTKSKPILHTSKNIIKAKNAPFL